MNIPSPYRWHLFTSLSRLGLERGIEFQVVFLAKNSPGRPWQLGEFPNTFAYHVAWGINFSKTNVRMFNPRLLIKMLFERWDWVIIGGYDNPTNALLAVLPLLRTKVKIIRNEGNLYAVSRNTGLIAIVKRFLLKQSSAYLVVGERAREWLRYWVTNYDTKPVHFFPNILDDETHVREVKRLSQDQVREKWAIGERRVFFSPARLLPVKGLVEFIENLPPDFGEMNLWIIAGEGPLRSRIEEQRNKKGFNTAIRLIGQVHHSSMSELYAVADVFLLPSLSDPNPLSVIEAAFAGLPLLVSVRAGNVPELVLDNQTGWIFDPTDSVSTKAALEKAIRASDSELHVLGEAAYERANSLFRSDEVCQQLLDFLLKIHPDSSTNEPRELNNDDQ